MNVNVDDIGFHLLDGSSELKEAKETIKLDPEVLERYAGRYKFIESKTVVDISREEDRLVFQVQGQANKLALFPESDTLFFMKEVSNKVEFIRDKSGKATGLILIRPDRKTVAKKIK